MLLLAIAWRIVGPDTATCTVLYEVPPLHAISYRDNVTRAEEALSTVSDGTLSGPEAGEQLGQIARAIDDVSIYLAGEFDQVTVEALTTSLNHLSAAVYNGGEEQAAAQDEVSAALEAAPEC